MSTISSSSQKIQQMLVMQNAMNNRISEQWRENNYEWYRAIWVECAEMLDHHGWKWWKHQEIDVAQVQLELVDIFHFGLGMKLMADSSIEEIAQQLATELSTPENHDDFKLALESHAGKALVEQRFDGHSFAACMQLIGMDLDELFRQYVGKNTLNFFRQDHGYKEGSYHKIWHGKEDNEVLAELVTTLDTNDSNFQKNLYRALENAYPTL